MSFLQARLVRPLPMDNGRQAEVALVEPNGDEHYVLCVARPDGTTEISGDGESLAYLNERYGEPAVCLTARRVVEQTG